MKKFALRNINWILTGVIVLALVGLIMLGVLYMGEESDHDALAETRVEKQAELDGLKAGEVDENAILAEAQAELEQLSSVFPAEMDDVDVMEFLMDLAHETNVTIDLKAGNPVEQEIAGGYYLSVPVTANINGTHSDVLNFIDRLESGEIATINITKCTISGEGAQWSASLTFGLTSRRVSD